jgi:esterase
LTTYGEIDAALVSSVPDTALRQFLIKNLVRNETGGFHWRIGLEAISDNYDELTQAIESTMPFTKPSLFIRAGRSRFIQDSDIADIRKIFSAAEIVMIADAGHWVHIEAAERFYQVVTQFLAPAKPQ